MREGVWVQAGDFDEAMLLIRDTFGLPHPESIRFDNVFQNYFESYQELSASLSQLAGATPESAALQEAVRRADEAFEDWRAVEVAASRLKDSDPDRAEAIYEQGLKQFPKSSPLLGNYYLFLESIRKDYDRAEEHYRRALEADSKDARHPGNYAVFLADIRKDYDRAEAYYRRALEADPKHANNLGNYGYFLHTIRKDYEQAEAYYRRALEADPKHANNLGNYAGFLLGRGRHGEGLALLDRALAAEGFSKHPTLPAECWFYALVHRPLDRQAEALKELKALLSAGGRSPGWDLGPHLAQAKARGRADLPWLEKLAAVISDGADIATLDGWAEWSRAS